eukprot:gene6835-8165_t
MDARFEGREELQLMEYDIQKYLNRLYKHMKANNKTNVV